jgi:hypothetical protein
VSRPIPLLALLPGYQRGAEMRLHRQAGAQEGPQCKDITYDKGTINYRQAAADVMAE